MKRASAMVPFEMNPDVYDTLEFSMTEYGVGAGKAEHDDGTPCCAIGHNHFVVNVQYASSLSKTEFGIVRLELERLAVYHGTYIASMSDNAVIKANARKRSTKAFTPITPAEWFGELNVVRAAA